jgi:hypothetical protein
VIEAAGYIIGAAVLAESPPGQDAIQELEDAAPSIEGASCPAPQVATRAFWVGPDGLAAAQASGAQVLQLSPEAQAALDAGDPTLMFQESTAFAQGATGENALAFIGNGKGYTFRCTATLVAGLAKAGSHG